MPGQIGMQGSSTRVNVIFSLQKMRADLVPSSMSGLPKSTTGVISRVQRILTYIVRISYPASGGTIVP